MLASTFPGRPDDGTPAFVRDLAIVEAEHFDTLVVVPRVPGSPRSERLGNLEVRWFPYFPRQWEDLAHGAIIENLRRRRSRFLQVVPLVVAEAVAVAVAVRRFRPDVVHAHWVIPQGLVARTVARRVPMVVTTLGGDLYALNARPLRALKGSVLRHAAAVTVMNAQMRDAALGLGANPGTTRVLPMGADLRAVAARRRPRPDGGPTRLLFVGRLVEKKGLAVLISALRPSDNGAVELSVVGDGPLRSELEQAAAGLPVTFLGQLGRPALMRAYAEHDVVVVPSVLAASGDQDGLPVALLEAMGSGCAIVASDLPGLNEAVEDGVSGALVPSGDADALRAALEGLVADPERRAAMGEAARRRAEDFSVDAIGRQYADLLLSLLPLDGVGAAR